MRTRNHRHVARVTWQARARYYAWCALRGHVLAGRDPVTGRPRAAWSWQDRAESRAAFVAMARHCLAQARAA